MFPSVRFLAGLVFWAVLIAGGMLAYEILGPLYRAQRESYEKAFQAWNQKWICSQCGYVFFRDL